MLKSALAASVLASAGSASGQNWMAGKRPNILFMVADNLGRESVGCYGSHIFKTPRLDGLAAEGIVFENCLVAAPLCAPARYSWNTGRYPYRGDMDTQPETDNPDSWISPGEVTIAQILRQAGYRTALVGKWNQGYGERSNPLKYGFDEFYGHYAGHADYYTHIYNSDMKKYFYRNLTPIDDQGYIDTLFTDEALRCLQRFQKQDQPFYLNLCFFSPHGPYQAPPGYYHSENPDVRYRYMIEYLDLCVGRVLDEIDRLGLAENTLVVFVSDQGSSQMNDFGRTLWEGGLKTIGIARWKGKTPPGTRVQAPWAQVDLYTTFAALGGAKVPTDRVIDGIDITPALVKGQEMAHNRTLYWSYSKEDAIRQGDWKLHLTNSKVDGLFDLSRDPDEKQNLAPQETARADKMLKMLQNWKAECVAAQPRRPRRKKQKKDKQEES
jgi:arylsulfatase A-like enzyme